MAWQQASLGRPDTVAATIREASSRGLAAAAARATELEPGLAVSTSLLRGAPAPALAAAAAGAAMLVVGSRGEGGFAALVLGSVSRYARCPVAIIPE